MQTIAFQNIRKRRRFKYFNSVQSKLLLERFEKDPYISYLESKDLARILNVNPERIIHWFQHRREMHKTESDVKRKDFLRMFNL